MIVQLTPGVSESSGKPEITGFAFPASIGVPSSLRGSVWRRQNTSSPPRNLNPRGPRL